MLGVIGWNAQMVICTDVDDTSSVPSEPIDPDTMHCIYWKAG